MKRVFRKQRNKSKTWKKKSEVFYRSFCDSEVGLYVQNSVFIADGVFAGRQIEDQSQSVAAHGFINIFNLSELTALSIIWS